MDDKVSNAELSGSLYQEALKFKSYVSIFTILTLLGSIGIGWVAAQQSTCDMSSFGNVYCTTDVDAATLIIVGACTFVGGMLFVLPLRGMTSVLTGVARLLEQGDSEVGPTTPF